MADPLVEKVEQDLEAARAALIEATTASIEADAALKGAQTRVNRLQGALAALKGEEPAKIPAKSAPILAEKPADNDELAQRKPVTRDEEAPAPADAGPKCRSCGKRGRLARITREVNGRQVTVVTCGACGTEYVGA